MADTDPRLAAQADAGLLVARHFDEDAFACDFGGVMSINLPNLDTVISLPSASLPPCDHAAELARLRETLLAAKAANENVLRLLAYWRLSEGHPGIFAREVDAALDAALRGADYQPLDVSHGQQVNWTRDRLRAALEPR